MTNNLASASGAEHSAKHANYSSVLTHSGTSTGCAAGRTGPGAPVAPPFTPNQYLSAYGIAAMHAVG